MPDFSHEAQENGCIVGVDEAGMGCWAGPVVAAAAFVPQDLSRDFLIHINDSKKLSRHKRDYLYACITQTPDIKFGVGIGVLEEIEKYNIRQASFIAMQRAISALPMPIDLALIDGNGAPKLSCAYKTITKGDQKSYSIAVASIIAKVTRDNIMVELGKEYPHYDWAQNAGYGTKKHQNALGAHGVTPHHRVTYAPIAKILEKK